MARELFYKFCEFSLFDVKTLLYSEGQFDEAINRKVFCHFPVEKNIFLIQEVHCSLRSGGSSKTYEHNPTNPLKLHAVNTGPFHDNSIFLKRS